jgi:NAD(P)-dependent dehydrogenase (short-subunit alcohol dehydrogenase family)
MGALDGRVAIVTGAGRGLGRAHALCLASEGACVVVNDVDAAMDGSGAVDSGDTGDGGGGPEDRAQEVVDEIKAAGGKAVANGDDVTDWDGGRRLVEQAVDTFGDLHVLVNNAGILRDRRLVNMSEQEWDDVIRVHLKGHFVPTRWAASFWRGKSKSGRQVAGSVVNTTSTSGLVGNEGQSNYGAAKAGIAAFTVITAMELAGYDVRCNAVAPAARTRMTESTPGLSDIVRAPADPDQFDLWDPANSSPLVAWLATAHCPLSGKILFIQGGAIRLFHGWATGEGIEKEGRWTVEELDTAMKPLMG